MKPTQTGLPASLAATAYLLISLSPLLIALLTGLPRRPGTDEIAAALGLLGLTWLLLSFLLSGRFRTISGRIGIDRTMRTHQLMAIILGALILLHPYLYTLPVGANLPWDDSRQHSLNLDTSTFITGMTAWILLPALILTAIFRDRLPCRYESWRLMHGIGAAIVALAAVHHALSAGRYSGQPALSVFWLGLIGIAALTPIRTYLVMPLLQSRRPWQVTAVKPAATRLWHITIKPARSFRFQFRAGQFVWLKLGPTPFTLTEHPFSISSSPTDLPTLRFTIKESGDFTRNIGNIPPGSRAFIDGPHGHFILDERQNKGIVFIVGGAGVAPVISIINDLAKKNFAEPVRLIYGNRVKSQILFQDELETAGEKLDLKIEYVLSEPPPDWTGKTGLLDTRLIKSTVDPNHPEKWLYFLCGPPGMLRAAVRTLKSAGVPAKQITYELFSYL